MLVDNDYQLRCNCEAFATKREQRFTDMYVCICNGINDRQVKEAVSAGPNNGPMFTRITAASQNAVDAALKFRNSLASQKRATPLLP